MIAYANARGNRAPHNAPSEPFDHSLLFNFTFPVCSSIYGRMAEVITPPPEKELSKEMIGRNRYPKNRASKTVKPKRERTAAVQAVLDRQKEIRINRFYPAMKSGDWMSVKDIADRIQISDDNARSVLNGMVKGGQVEFEKRSHKEAFYRWANAKLTGSGTESG